MPGECREAVVGTSRLARWPTIPNPIPATRSSSLPYPYRCRKKSFCLALFSEKQSLRTKSAQEQQSLTAIPCVHADSRADANFVSRDHAARGGSAACWACLGVSLGRG